VDANQEIYERDAQRYADTSLLPPEEKVLGLLGDRWRTIEMLDVGIGAGRTTRTFAAMVKRYVGIDYSPRMVERAKRSLGEGRQGVELLVADARDLSSLEGNFGFVLFSFNGLDSVGHEDRLKVLSELRRMAETGGAFFFSSHSLNALPLTLPPELRDRRHPPQLVQRLDEALEKVNEELDLAAARARGWAIVRDGAHNFELELYYVDPEYQVRQLRDSGFETLAIYDKAGREVAAGEAGTDPWLHYYCRAA